MAPQKWSDKYKEHNGIGQPGVDPHPEHADPKSKTGCQCVGDETYPGGCKAERAKAAAPVAAPAPVATAPPAPASNIES